MFTKALKLDGRAASLHVANAIFKCACVIIVNDVCSFVKMDIVIVICMMGSLASIQCAIFIYLFKISDRRTRGPLILSEEHRNT